MGSARPRRMVPRDFLLRAGSSGVESAQVPSLLLLSPSRASLHPHVAAGSVWRSRLPHPIKRPDACVSPRELTYTSRWSGYRCSHKCLTRREPHSTGLTYHHASDTVWPNALTLDVGPEPGNMPVHVSVLSGRLLSLAGQSRSCHCQGLNGSNPRAVFPLRSTPFSPRAEDNKNGGNGNRYKKSLCYLSMLQKTSRWY